MNVLVTIMIVILALVAIVVTGALSAASLKKANAEDSLRIMAASVFFVAVEVGLAIAGLVMIQTGF